MEILLLGAKPALIPTCTVGVGRLQTRNRMIDAGFAVNLRNGATMKNLRTLSAAVALAAMLPLATPTPSLAADWGPGRCTRPAGDAVGWDGPAMNAGQLMAGVGQCQRIGNSFPYYGPGYSSTRVYGPDR